MGCYLTNSSFYSNDAYSEGKDIMNIDKGIVNIDGKNYTACGGGKHCLYEKFKYWMANCH